MISRRISLLVAAALAVLPGHLLAQQTDDRPGVAVMRFDNGGSHGPEAESEDYDALEVGLQQMLLTELSQNPELRTVERSRIADITREQGLVDQGLVDPSTAAEIGRLVGARYMVMGSFADLFGDMRLDVRVVDTETGEIVASGAVQDQREETLQMLVQLADDIATRVDLPALPEDVREDRQEEAERVPAEGFDQYSRALMLIDEGFEEEGIQTLERVVRSFPDWEEPERELEQMRSRGSAGT